MVGVRLFTRRLVCLVVCLFMSAVLIRSGAANATLIWLPVRSWFTIAAWSTIETTKPAWFAAAFNRRD